MKRLIAYASTKGTVEKCAHALAEKLEGADLYALGRGAEPDLDDYDQVILGSSIHAGQPQKKMVAFREKYKQELLARDLGLFICCLSQEQEDQYLTSTYGEELLSHARGIGKFGAELIFSQYNFIIRFMLKKINGSSEDIHKIRHEEIEGLARILQDPGARRPEK